MTQHRTALPIFLLVLFFLAAVPLSLGQTEAATLSGLITDPQGKVVPDVAIEVANVDTNVSVHQNTNNAGLYVVVGLKPGRYRVTVTKDGFRRIDLTDLVLNVQDVLSRNFQLQLGSVMASITVVADEAKINTESAAVSTVVDRQFAENLPLNGRSFQTLIQLTPGVVVVPSNTADSGQFSVNGQRANANYWMVDGVSANTGISAVFPGNGLAGALPSFNVLGGTSSLVSVDAMQEFRIQTSTYAPEFGRTPGAQISILTRSGGNVFHGTLFEYFRNDILDANDWFANYLSQPKPEERQNDFGGTFSGPILGNRTFFFFSYEGLRLRLPQVAQSQVPDANARNSAIPALQPYLNAFPLPTPNTPDDISNGIGQFNSSFSNRATNDAYSLRIDHKLTENFHVFGRYAYSPSEIVQRSSAGSIDISLNTVFPARITSQTATVGITWMLSPAVVNDLRFNYSRATARSSYYLDGFGGAKPLAAPPFPNGYNAQNAFFFLDNFSLKHGALFDGLNEDNLQRQINLIDNLSIQRSTHSLKWGLDYRRLLPTSGFASYTQNAFFSDVPSFENGSLAFAEVTSGNRLPLLFQNIGIFGQDTWRASRYLTLTYGVRWDVDFAPSTTSGPSYPAATDFNLNDLSSLALAPPGTSAFKTTYGNIAPRIGLAYEVSHRQGWTAVLRGGFGLFYDLATQEVGNTFRSSYPFGGTSFPATSTFPLDAASAAPPPITPSNIASGELAAFDPNLKLPYTLEWNVAAEQELGSQQSLSVAYIGSDGRRLLQTAYILAPNANVGAAYLVTNAGVSNYNALQLQFNRRLAHGLQALASYTWSHSIDTASAGSLGSFSNLLLPSISNANRGPSDFDIRNAFAAGFTYEIPAVIKANSLAAKAFAGWSVQNVLQGRSAPPVDTVDQTFFALSGQLAAVRPDLISGEALYLYGANCASVLQAAGDLSPGQSCPGGKVFNAAAFKDPPVDANGNPTRQGNVPRNFLRGFAAIQWDLGVHRDFPIHEALRLQFRAEMFNILNHPNFGQPSGQFGAAGFGLSSQMLGRSLGGNQGGGGFNALYQIGGPRSIQLALKLLF
jgi:hypothetical protein